MQKEPAVQSRHAVPPVPSWNLPASHLVHVPCLAACCTVPALHGVGLRAPALQNEPSGQSMHCSALSRPGSLEKVPTLHGSAAEAPSSQNEPDTHSTHAVAPLAAMNLPASHLAHVPCLC